MTKFLPPLAPGDDIYRKIHEIAPKEGSKVRVSIPGLPRYFDTEVTYRREDGSQDYPMITLGDQQFFIGDRANGRGSGHDWVFEFEDVQPTAWEKFLALPLGAKFRLSSETQFVKVSDYQFAALNPSNSMLWDYRVGMGEYARFTVIE